MGHSGGQKPSGVRGDDTEDSLRLLDDDMDQ